MTELSALPAHHQASIARVVAHFEHDPEVQALLLTGSLAHGFYRENSDVDIAIVVSSADYQARLARGELGFFSDTLCTYPGGYADGKYIDLAFIQTVAERGSEPARFAFKDATILFSRIDTLQPVLDAACHYPKAGKDARIIRFLAQFEAWGWYVGQALQTGDRYLLNQSTAKLALFACRLILAHNEMLYPFHKWLTRVVSQAPQKPDGFMPMLNAMLESPSQASLEALQLAVRGFTAWPATPEPWPMQFLRDSELNWLNSPPPVDDL